MDLKKFETVDLANIPLDPINRGIQAASAPPKAAPQGTGDFQDPDAFMAGQVQRAPRTQAPHAAVAKQATPLAFAEQVMASRQESGAIKRLRAAFGVAMPEGLIEDSFGGFKWTFRVPSSVDIQYAVTITQDVRDMEGDLGEDATNWMFNLALRRAFVAVSVAAIDDRPTYEHFGLQVPAGYSVPDPMNPPRHLRIRAANHLYEMLSDETVNDLTLGLTAIYDKRVSPLVQKAASPLASAPPSVP